MYPLQDVAKITVKLRCILRKQMQKHLKSQRLCDWVVWESYAIELSNGFHALNKVSSESIEYWCAKWVGKCSYSKVLSHAHFAIESKKINTDAILTASIGNSIVNHTGLGSFSTFDIKSWNFFIWQMCQNILEIQFDHLDA